MPFEATTGLSLIDDQKITQNHDISRHFSGQTRPIGWCFLKRPSIHRRGVLRAEVQPIAEPASAYEAALAYELEKRGLHTVRQQAVPIVYQGTRIEVLGQRVCFGALQN
jgi:hypothetical protein